MALVIVVFLVLGQLGPGAAAQDEQPVAEQPAAEQPAAEEPAPEPAAPEEQPAPEEVEPPAPEGDSGESKEQEPKPPKEKRIIGATAVLKEYKSGLLFKARVDTGAKSCSLNVDRLVIENEVTEFPENDPRRWEANIGKVVKFRVRNGSDKAQWIESKIEKYVIIKTAEGQERRYKVPLQLQWKDVKKRVLVTLNNRGHMSYPLLLGRNFLRGDFLVDVEMDSDD